MSKETIELRIQICRFPRPSNDLPVKRCSMGEKKMKFLCLVAIDEKKLAAMSADEFQALDDASLAHDQIMRNDGHLVTASALQPARAAVTVKVPNGKPLIIDGPFAETKEQVGGFLLIDARDLDEAVRLAWDIPVAKYGSIEVRPCRDLATGEKWQGRRS
jgi:hypothetical protein